MIISIGNGWYKVNKDFCDTVRKTREKFGITQREFAESIGVSRSTACRIEKGWSHEVSAEVIRKIEDSLYIKFEKDSDDSFKTPEQVLRNSVTALQTENKSLKTLLINYWNKENGMFEVGDIVAINDTRIHGLTKDFPNMKGAIGIIKEIEIEEDGTKSFVFGDRGVYDGYVFTENQLRTVTLPELEDAFRKAMGGR